MICSDGMSNRLQTTIAQLTWPQLKFKRVRVGHWRDHCDLVRIEHWTWSDFKSLSCWGWWSEILLVSTGLIESSTYDFKSSSSYDIKSQTTQSRLTYSSCWYEISFSDDGDSDRLWPGYSSWETSGTLPNFDIEDRDIETLPSSLVNFDIKVTAQTRIWCVVIYNDCFSNVEFHHWSSESDLQIILSLIIADIEDSTIRIEDFVFCLNSSSWLR